MNWRARAQAARTDSTVGVTTCTHVDGGAHAGLLGEIRRRDLRPRASTS